MAPPAGERIFTIRLVAFDTIPECDGRTTDGRRELLPYINIALCGHKD